MIKENFKISLYGSYKALFGANEVQTNRNISNSNIAGKTNNNNNSNE